MKRSHEILFSPYRLGGVELKNRYAMVAMGTGGMVTQENTFNQRGIDYYVERARGGVGLIITGNTILLTLGKSAEVSHHGHTYRKGAYHQRNSHRDGNGGSHGARIPNLSRRHGLKAFCNGQNT